MSTSETPVAMAKNSMPWESGSSEGKYQYHPGGDASAAPKSAPSAVNVVVVPDVSLPKVCLHTLPIPFPDLHNDVATFSKVFATSEPAFAGNETNTHALIHLIPYPAVHPQA